MKVTGNDEEKNVNTKNPEFLSWQGIKISKLTNFYPLMINISSSSSALSF